MSENISKIKVNGTTHEIEDSVARKGIDEVNSSLDTKVSKAGGTITGNLFTQGGTNTFYAIASSATVGYLKVATITIKSSYADYPLMFEVTNRAQAYPMKLHLMFKSSGTTDPEIDTFHYEGVNIGAYMIRKDAGVWELYISKSSWSGITISDYKKDMTLTGKIDVEFSTSEVDVLPDGAIPATNGNINSSVKAALAEVNANLTFRGETDDLEALINDKIYFSVVIHSFLGGSTISSPVASSGFVITHHHNVDNALQWTYHLNGSRYYRRKTSGVVGQWILEPSREEFDNLNANFKNYVPSSSGNLYNPRILQQNNDKEGGEILLRGAGDYPDWNIDLYADTLRIFSVDKSTKEEIARYILHLNGTTKGDNDIITKADLDTAVKNINFKWKSLTNFDVDVDSGLSISYSSVPASEILVSYGKKNGGQSFGGGTVLFNPDESKPCYLPIYDTSGLVSLIYIFNNPDDQTISIKRITSTQTLRCRIYYR